MRMRITLPRSAWLGGRRVPLAVLAVAAGTLVLLVALFRQDGGEPASHAASLQGATLALCVEGALMVHDVRWAAACSAEAERGLSDGHAECELPLAEAERLNALLQQAEQSCHADAGLRPPR